MKQKLSKFFNGLAEASVVVAGLATALGAASIPYTVAKLTEHTAVCDVENSRVGMVGGYETRHWKNPDREMNWIETENCGTLNNEIKNSFMTDPNLGFGRYASDYQKTFCEAMPGDSINMVLFNWPPGQTRIKEIVGVVKHDPSKVSPYASGPQKYPEYCATFLKKRADSDLPISGKKAPTQGTKGSRLKFP